MQRFTNWITIIIIISRCIIVMVLGTIGVDQNEILLLRRNERYETEEAVSSTGQNRRFFSFSFLVFDKTKSD